MADIVDSSLTAVSGLNPYTPYNSESPEKDSNRTGTMNAGTSTQNKFH